MHTDDLQINNNENELTYRRGSRAALIGLSIQLVVTAVVLGVSIWLTQNGLPVESAAFSVAFFIFLPGVFAWLILYLIYRQHRQERLESLTLEAESRSDAQLAALFDRQGESLKSSRRMLKRMYRFGLPGVSLLMGLSQTVLGLMGVLGGSFETSAIEISKNASWLMTTLATGCAFIAFVVGRYVAGMTQHRSWRLLRGGGGLLMGVAVMSFMLAAGGICSQIERPEIWPWIVLILKWILLLTGLEILLAMLLGFYRPRREDEPIKAAFESRLLAWLSAPKSIGTIFKETINYQFGFEVSKSAFYQLMGKAAIPLIFGGVLILALCSMVVVVAPQEEAIITTFGKPAEKPVDSGLHLKWPWPISKVTYFSTKRIYTLVLGSHTELPPYATPILWTNNHLPGENMQLMVTAPTRLEENNKIATQSSGDQKSQADELALALSGGQVVIQFQIRDLMKFTRNVPESVYFTQLNRARQTYDRMQDDEAAYLTAARHVEAYLQRKSPLLSAIAETEISEFFATHTIEEMLGNMTEKYGTTEGTASQILQRRIQQEYDLKQTGIEVVHVSLSGIHPPQGGVAEAFLNLIGKQQERETTIEQARQEAIEILASVAGSKDEAEKINKKIRALRGQYSIEDINAIEDLIAQSRGRAAREILAARAMKTIMALGEKAQAQKFDAQYEAYKLAPRYFLAQKYLEAREKAMNQSRFMIIDRDENDAEPIIRMQMTEESRLSDILAPSVE